MRKKPSAKAPTQRQLRVGEEIKRVVSNIFERGEIREPEVENAVITVTEVRISPDLKNAKIFIITFNGENVENIIKILNESKWYFRKQLSKNMVCKFTPEVRFYKDDSFDEAFRIESLLRDPKVASDIAKNDE